MLGECSKGRPPIKKSFKHCPNTLGKYDVICDILPPFRFRNRGFQPPFSKRRMGMGRRRGVVKELGSFLWLHLPSPSPPPLSFLLRRWKRSWRRRRWFPCLILTLRRRGRLQRRKDDHGQVSRGTNQVVSWIEVVARTTMNFMAGSMRQPTLSLTTLPTTRSSQSQVSIAIWRAHVAFAWHSIRSHPLLHREEDDDDEQTKLLQRYDAREQSDQRHDDRQVWLQADPGLWDQLQVA